MSNSSATLDHLESGGEEMLSRQDNELLCRVGPGTPMGKVLREYWTPILLTSELPSPDGPPMRVRVFGENLVAFRDSNGKVGLVVENCPHRGASLFFGRNEEEGLRCVYHGWKFNAEGACVDMPNEPPESNFKHKVRVGAYPCRERNGTIWAYLGSLDPAPPLPDFEWNLVPERQQYISKRWQSTSFAQAFEGGIDSSHSGFLHSPVSSHRAGSADDHEKNPELQARGGSRGMIYKAKDKHPRFETVNTDFGVLIGARRNAEEGNYYWRINIFLMPFYTMAPPYGPDPTLNCSIWVPIDDENTMRWSCTWHPTREITDEEIAAFRSGNGIHSGPQQLLPPTSAAGGAWRPIPSMANDFLMDRAVQRTVQFSGIPYTWNQDAAMQESMGPIIDRTKEHLGSSDAGVIQARRRLLNAAKALETEGVAPPGSVDPSVFSVRPAAVVLPAETFWVEGAKAHLTAASGAHHSAA
jgi:nitrite reductase/ring-hydroxylating ferredoxin subunit